MIDRPASANWTQAVARLACVLYTVDVLRSRIGFRRAGPWCLLAAAAVTISSCTASVTGGVRTAGYVVVALAEAPGVLDPTQASTYVGRIVFANMCEKLYDVNSK